jgi:hypothetical protein
LRFHYDRRGVGGRDLAALPTHPVEADRCVTITRAGMFGCAWRRRDRFESAPRCDISSSDQLAAAGKINTGASHPPLRAPLVL